MWDNQHKRNAMMEISKQCLLAGRERRGLEAFLSNGLPNFAPEQCLERASSASREHRTATRYVALEGISAFGVAGSRYSDKGWYHGLFVPYGREGFFFYSPKSDVKLRSLYRLLSGEPPQIN